MYLIPTTVQVMIIRLSEDERDALAQNEKTS